mgnify:CR=1 FL=1
MSGPAQGQQQRLVILGAGTGGTLAANRLRKKYKDDRLRIDIVDQDNRHVYQPGLLFVPFGLTEPDEIVRKRDRQLKKGIHYHQCPIESVDIETNTVELQNGTTLEYDVLLVATGAVLLPDNGTGSLVTDLLQLVDPDRVQLRLVEQGGVLLARQPHRPGPAPLAQQAQFGLGQQLQEAGHRAVESYLDYPAGHRADIANLCEIEAQRRAAKSADRL